jgi:hypothetical protein
LLESKVRLRRPDLIIVTGFGGGSKVGLFRRGILLGVERVGSRPEEVASEIERILVDGRRYRCKRERRGYICKLSRKK